MKPDELIALNEQIAGMSRAGLPLDQGLAAMAREMGRSQLQKVTQSLADDLRAGHPLPEALERQKNQVPPFYASLVAAGVRTGRIAEVLATLTIYARTMAGVRTIIREALFYPITVLLFAFLMFLGLGYFVLPQFDLMFREFGLSLPVVSQLVLTVLTQPMRFFVYPLAVITIVVTVIRWQLRRTEAGRILWAHCIYSLPIVGTLIRAARLAAFADLLAILVDYAVPLPEAFLLAGAASSDPIMVGTAKEVEHGLKHGMPLGETLRGRGLVPEWVAWMVGLGEQRGSLGQTLHQVAEVYRRQVEMRAALLRSVLPPFLIIVIAGIFFGVFICAVMLPMVRLLEGLSS